MQPFEHGPQVLHQQLLSDEAPHHRLGVGTDLCTPVCQESHYRFGCVTLATSAWRPCFYPGAAVWCLSCAPCCSTATSSTATSPGLPLQYQELLGLPGSPGLSQEVLALPILNPKPSRISTRAPPPTYRCGNLRTGWTFRHLVLHHDVGGTDTCASHIQAPSCGRSYCVRFEGFRQSSQAMPARTQDLTHTLRMHSAPTLHLWSLFQHHSTAGPSSDSETGM